MRNFVLVFLPATLVLFHCGGTVASSQSGGTTSGSGGSGTSSSSGSGASTTTSSSTGGGGGPSTLCPPQPPTLGGACDVPGTAGSPPCTYGNDPLPECRQAFVCADGLWGHADGAFGPCSSMTACPPSPPAGGSDCSGTSSPECVYPDGTFCSCGSFAGPEWLCYVPAGGCPKLVPNAGTACAMEGLSCGYEGCNLEVFCHEGVWQWSHVDC